MSAEKIVKEGIVKQIEQLNRTLEVLNLSLNPILNEAYLEVVEKILELTRKL